MIRKTTSPFPWLSPLLVSLFLGCASTEGHYEEGPRAGVLVSREALFRFLDDYGLGRGAEEGGDMLSPAGEPWSGGEEAWNGLSDEEMRVFSGNLEGLPEDTSDFFRDDRTHLDWSKDRSERRRPSLRAPERRLPSLPRLSIDEGRMQRLASLGLRLHGESDSVGRCLAGVAQTMASETRGRLNFYDPALDRGEKGEDWVSPGRSADLFLRWAVANPKSLCAEYGLARARLASWEESPPAGSLLLYERGRCGYHPQHGHIEIVTGEWQACSDHCSHVKRDCTPTAVLVPVAGCRGARK